MKEIKEYREINDLSGYTHLRISVYYHLGGTNLFSGGSESRGYYLSVTPVTKNGITESYTLFSGLKQFIMGANRFSQKQLMIAKEKSTDMVEELVQQVILQNKKTA